MTLWVHKWKTKSNVKAYWAEIIDSNLYGFRYDEWVSWTLLKRKKDDDASTRLELLFKLLHEWHFEFTNERPWVTSTPTELRSMTKCHNATRHVMLKLNKIVVNSRCTVQVIVCIVPSSFLIIGLPQQLSKLRSSTSRLPNNVTL